MSNINCRDIKNFWMESSDYTCKQVFGSYIPGKHSYYVYDVDSVQYEWMSDTVEEVLGYGSSHLNILQAFEKVHIEDRLWCEAIENKIQALLDEFGSEWLSHYKIVYDFRFMHLSGNYIRLLMQMIQIYDAVLCTNKRYGLIIDISHIKKSGEPVFSLIGLDGYDALIDIPLFLTTAKKDCPLTKREKEISTLIFKGLSNKEIADKLHVSFDTVKNHKKNIFNKLDCNSSVQLLKKCIAFGWNELYLDSQDNEN